MTQIIQTPEMKAAQEKHIAGLTEKYGENWRSSPEYRKDNPNLFGLKMPKGGPLGRQAPGGGYMPEKSGWEQMTQQAPVAPSGGDLPGYPPSGGDLPGGATRQSLQENMSAGTWGGGPNLQVHRQAPESPSIAAPNITKPQPRPKRPGLHSGGGDKLFKITPAESA